MIKRHGTGGTSRPARIVGRQERRPSGDGDRVDSATDSAGRDCAISWSRSVIMATPIGRLVLANGLHRDSSIVMAFRMRSRDYGSVSFDALGLQSVGPDSMITTSRQKNSVTFCWI